MELNGAMKPKSQALSKYYFHYISFGSDLFSNAPQYKRGFSPYAGANKLNRINFAGVAEWHTRRSQNRCL